VCMYALNASLLRISHALNECQQSQQLRLRRIELQTFQNSVSFREAAGDLVSRCLPDKLYGRAS